MTGNHQHLTGLIWSISETLRGKFILPFVVMRRLDCVLEGSKDAVLKAAENLPDDTEGRARFTAMIRSAVVTRVRSLAARGLAAGLLAAVAACLALPLQAVTLVNNLSESTTSTPSVGGSSNFRQAQKFTVPTGQDYSLDDVTIGVGFRGADGIVVSIRDGSAADPPGTALYTLINPASPGTGNQVYSAPAGAVLAGGNSYFVMLERAQNSGGSSTVRGTDDDGQSGETGWLIDDVRRKRSGATWSDDTHALKIRIRGDVYTPSTDATLSDLELEGATGGEVILLIPGFDSATETYTASVANRIDAVTLTARKNDTTATVAITSDDDTSTEGEADLDLNVGSNTLTVTVTPESGAAKTYTITVTRAAVPPAPTDCPADTDWCTTLGVGYETDSTASFKIDYWGYRSDRSYGDLLSTTFSHGGTGYTVSQVSRNKITQLPGNTVVSDSVNIKISPVLPDGTVLQLGSRTFTVDTDSATNTIGLEQWGILGNPLSWTAGQHVTASLKFPTAPNQPTGLTATANGATQIDLAWVAPTDNGGATISGYRIEVSADAGTTWTNLLANTGTTSVTYSHTGLTRGSTRHYRVSAINANGTGAASDATSATTATPTPPAPPEITVPNDWSLIPTGLSTGDKFRLIFLSSTKRNAGSTDIADYNSFIQNRAAAGHTDIQTYSAGFRAVGCTADSDARDNTATTGTGVVIHWLNGNKVADDYADFYDGSWDDEANDKEEDGTDGPDTTMDGNFPWTGCEHNGTEATFGSSSRALGASAARLGIPNSSVTSYGPLSSATNPSSSDRHPMYGLSQVFEVADAGNTAATGTPSIDGTPQVGMVLTAAKGTLADADGTTKADNGDTGYAYSYQWVRVDGSTDSPITSATAITYTLTAADLGKTIKVQTSFTDDGDTAEGPLTSAATVAVLAAAGACPTDNDWCTTLTVEFRQQSPSVQYYGYIENFGTGALGDRTINYGGRNWRLDALYIRDDAGTRTIRIEDFFTNGFLPRGSVFNLGGQDFTTNAAAEDFATKIYEWPVPAGMAWIDGQEVTVSVTLANFAATGKPAISGTAQVGETLTAAIGNIADTDGLPATFPDDYTFQWLRRDGGTDSPITGATASTYTLTAADLGKTIKVQTSFTDDGDTAEGPFTSAATVAVLAAAGACPTDNDWCTTLTVEFRQQSPSVQYYGYADSISLGALDDSAINYGGRRWRIYALYITDDAGTRTIKVDFPIADGFLPRGSVFNLGGQDFTATAAAEDATQGIYNWPVPAAMAWIDGQAVTVSVDLANFAATGEPTISGTAQVGETLTAGIGDIADTDGLPATFPGDYTFQWLRRDGGTDSTITGATAITYTPVAADVGKKVKVTVSFTDDGGTGEARTSNAYPSSGTITAGTLPALSFVSNEVTVDEDAGTATLTIELDPASTGTVTVDFATRDRLGDAIAGEDYTTTSGTLTFAATETSKTITVPITDDDVYENALEVFYVDLSNPTGATLPDPPSAGIGINSEDAVPTASMADVTVDEGAGTMTLILRLSHPSHEDIAYVTRVVDVTGTATEGDDYDDFLLGPAGTARITVPGGDLSQTFDITLVDDGVDEADETIIILWQKSTSDEVTPVAINFTGTITDNDTAGVTLSKTLLTVTEEDTTGDSYSVVLNSQPTADVVVTVAGHSGTDVTPTPTTLTFTPINWETVQPVTVTAGTDMDMVNETVSLTHSAASTDANYNGITIGGVAVSVHDDDTGNNLATGKPAISGTAQEGETLTAAIGNIADTDGLPTTFPDDYAFQWLRVDADGMSNETDIGADAVTYAPVAADVGKKVKVKVHFTDADSNPETLASNAYPSSGTITAGTLPVLSISGITVDEDAGPATLTVELTPASTGTVTVDYATRDQVGGAKAGDDYTATSGTLTFTAGQTSKTITVPITDDDIYENYEAFFVDLSNPTGATLPVFPTAAVGIDSEDAVPTASMADVTVDEGAGTMTLILRLSHLSHEDIAYSTVDTRVTGTATEGEDYDDFLLGPPAGTARITVPAGSLSQTFDITVVDDGVDEPDETIVILWQKVTGDDVTPTTFTFTGTIVPEPLPALSFALSVVTVDEDAGSATHTVELTPASTGTVTVDYATRDHGAKAGEDYTATSGTLTFTAGQTSKTITVPILNDDAYEAPGLTGEIFFIDLSNPTGATLPDPPLTGVIIDSEEAVPTASMADVTVDEGAGTMTLTLRLSHPSQKDITYFTREDDVTGTATEGEDYDDFLLETGRIAESTVPGGSLSQTFDITIVDDGVDEPDETIIIVWQKSTSDKVTPEFFTFTGTIVPEPLPALSFVPSEVTVDEDAGPATLTVELTPASTGTVTVDYATRDSFAKAGEDYTATSGTLTFAAGQTSKTFTVPITDDDVYENNEAFFVDLSNPTGATLPDPPFAAVRIDSGEAAPTASMADVTVDEGAGTMTLTLRLSHPSDAEIAYFTIYDEDIATGTATEGEDYDDFLLGPPGRTARITVPAGDLSQTFDITLVDDGVDEPDETIVIEWIRNSNDDATPDFITFTGTITDNDTADNNPTVRFGASSYTAIEGVAGAVVTVELNPAATRAVNILVTATPQGGASSADYSGVPGSVTFAAGETEKSFTVTATDDTVDDDGESLQLGFDALPSGVLLGSPATARVALVEDVDVSTWFLFFEESSYTATEGGTAARVTVGLSNPWKPALNEPLTIGIFTPEHRGGADASDYSGVPERVTFRPGQTRVSFTVTATNDSDDDDGESIYLQFAGFDIEDLELDRGPRAATVHLRDNDGASAVQAFFGAQTYSVEEGSAVDVFVHLDKAPGRALTLLITTAHGNGASSADYSGVPESITFSSSQSTRTFEVQARNDNVNDDQEYLTFGFGELPASVSAGDPATTTLNLIDSIGSPSDRTISFDSQDTNVRELLEGSIYSLYVYLDSAANNDIVVPLEVEEHLDGATTADYSGLPETVIIPAGERRENVIIRVLEDAEDDHGEGIRVRFGSLPRGVRKDNQADTATFRFLDNDTLPAISIAGADVKEWPNPQSYLRFVASLDYAPEFEVAVDYRTVNGSAVAGQDYESASGTLTFAEGERSKYIRVLVCHDGIDESTETITLQLSNPVRTKLEGNGSATGSIRNNNGSGAKPCATGISVSDVSYPEPNINHLRRQKMQFEVSLNQADTGTVTVDYRTVEGTATAGEDYESASGTVTFRPGQTRRTVKVVVVADAHDDPGETFTLRLSNPSGAYIGDGEGTATLTNSGLMPGAWLSRFGRVASDHAVQAIEARIYDTSGHARENHLTIGGQRVDWQMLGRFAPSGPGQRGDRASPDGVAPRLDPWLGDQAARTRMDRLGAEAMAVRSPAVGSLSVGGMADLDSGGSPVIDSLSGEGMAGVDSGHARGSGGGDAKGTFRRAVMELLGLEDLSRLSEAGVGVMGSSFFYSRPGGDEAPGWLGPWSLWGETAVTRFDGAEGPLSLNGDVTTATVGFDTRRERWMAGLALAYSEGQGAYTHRIATGGAMDSSLTSLIPYASYSLNERTSVWGTLGYGVGDLTLTPEGAASGIETDLSTSMAAFGGRGVFSVRTAGAAQFEFAVRADARLTSTVSDAVENLAGAAGATSRVRVVLEGSGSLPVWGGMLRPTMEAGLRYDGGDAETGAGLEIGGGLGYAAGNLSVEVSARGLVAHQDTEYEEWGFSGSIAYTPSEDGRGLSMRLGSAWGATQSGVQSLWNQQDASGLARNAAFEAAQRFEAELGYGIAGRRRNSLWVPFIAAQAADGGGQALQMGVRLASESSLEAELRLGRRQDLQGVPKHAVELRASMRW